MLLARFAASRGAGTFNMLCFGNVHQTPVYVPLSDWLALAGTGALDALYFASGTAGIASHAPLAKVLSAPPSVIITNMKVFLYMIA